MTKYLQWINYAGAFFAVVAAVLWFLSARVRTPNQFSIQAIAGGGFGAIGGPVGGGTVYPVVSQDLTKLANALIWQSRLSAAAAICAGISAILGAVSLAAAPSN